MSPSRRQLLSAIGAMVALSGCSASGIDSETTETPSAASASNQSISDAIEARLLGPAADQLLFDGSAIARVGEVTETQEGVQLPIELTDAGTTAVVETFREANVAATPAEFEIQLLDGGEEFNRFTVSGGLASAVESGDWDGAFVMSLTDVATAERVRSRFVAEDQSATAQ